METLINVQRKKVQDVETVKSVIAAFTKTHLLALPCKVGKLTM